MQLHVVVWLLLLGFCWAHEVDAEDAREGFHWAVLVAGSKWFYNYRHQADVCHAYHIMRRHGIPEERIIVMMYDDIAHDKENPMPGILLNHPNGSDVYGGVVIDYRGDDVTPQNFLAVIHGDEDAVKGNGSGRVLKSGPNDNVFINLVDHGAAGLFGFPNDFLMAGDLLNMTLTMYHEKRFRQLVYYVESCESGSMFEGILPQDINVYAVTASNSEQSSYACYHHPKEYELLIGDEFSVRWMEDSDKNDLAKETLQEQYTTAKKLTLMSPVCRFGDLGISKQAVVDFQGDGLGPQPKPIVLPFQECGVTPTRAELAPLHRLHRKLIAAKSVAEERTIRDEMLKLLELHRDVDKTVKTIVSMATRNEHTTQQIIDGEKRQLKNHDCYEPAVKLFHKNCFNLGQNLYARRQMYTLVNMCEQGIGAGRILNAIATVCKS